MAEIRQALAQCFKELMQEKSFQKIIVKDITDRANVKRPTFYTYSDVVEWIFMQERKQARQWAISTRIKSSARLQWQRTGQAVICT